MDAVRYNHTTIASTVREQKHKPYLTTELIQDHISIFYDLPTQQRILTTNDNQISLKVHSFVRSLLRAGVQPTLDPSAETFMAVQCASPERGGELVGV